MYFLSFQHFPFYRKGTALIALLTFISILFIIGLSFIFVSSGEKGRATLVSESVEAFYLAESGLVAAQERLKELFSRPLINPQGDVDLEILNILDIDRAERFMDIFEMVDLPLNSRVEIKLSFKNLNKTPFVGYIDEYEEVPETLKTYKRAGREQEALRGLGGWSGNVLIESTGIYKGFKRKVLVEKKIKISDLTPIGENYTLFIGSKKDEYLKTGEFRLSNFNFSRDIKGMVDELVNTITDSVIRGLGKAAISLFWDPNTKTYVSFTGDFKTKALSIIRDLVMGNSDLKIKDYVDEIIAELNPYRWGRIRTNGKLHIYLPFFMADDIVNYFDDNSIFTHQRPEIGYLYCYNLLHDPYLSRYTYYEGKIIKYFQKLKPYILGETKKPYPAFEPYTITTRFDYVNRNSDKLKPTNYDRVAQHARDYCDQYYEKDLTVHGTFKEPAQYNGLHYIQGNLNIGGFMTGRAMFVVEGNIHFTGDLRKVKKKDLLSLVALNKKINLTRSRHQVDAALFSRHSLSGGDLIAIMGNLVVDELNRQNGLEGDLLMPKRVRISYDPDIKSGAANNISLGISELITGYRDIPAR